MVINYFGGTFMESTIAAISTAMSASGIGIVRISGDEAFSIIDKIYKLIDNRKSKLVK